MLVLAILFTMASFPATAAAKNPKRVKIFTTGDSLTAGVWYPNAYRYFIYENLIKDGGVFEFIGPKTGGDFRVNEMYRKHGGVGGAIIGCAEDYEWTGSMWTTSSWNVTTENGIYIRSSGNKNSLHYRLFAGSDGSNDYTKTEYGNYVKEADIVIMYIGLNDYYDTHANGISADVEHVIERYCTLIDRVYEINPDVSLYVCALNELDYIRGYNLKPGDSGYQNSVFKFNELLMGDVVDSYKAKGYKIAGIDLNQPEYKLVIGVDNPEDDAHPNESGNRKIGTCMYKAIRDEVLELNKQESDVEYNPVRVTGITLSKTSANLTIGKKLKLAQNSYMPVVIPTNAEIITTLYSSSNESVATVNKDGEVIAVSEGTATIYATALDSLRPGATKITATCEVTVTLHPVETPPSPSQPEPTPEQPSVQVKRPSRPFNSSKNTSSVHMLHIWQSTPTMQIK